MGSGGIPDTVVARAGRLFEFLARSQQLRTSAPRTTDSYESVLWLGELPEHPAVRRAPEPGALLFEVARVPRVPAPEPPEVLDRWLDGPVDEPGARPRLVDTAVVHGVERSRADDPEIATAYDAWLVDWSAWAGAELAQEPARAVYNQVFATYVAATDHSDELELVVAVGCLSWKPGAAIRRHLITAPAAITFDDDNGRLAVRAGERLDGAAVELDMLDPDLIADAQHVRQVRAELADADGEVLDREVAGALARRLTHAIDGDGEYTDDDAPRPPGRHAATSFAPAVVLRKRSRQGLVDILDTISRQITDTGTVPDGLLPLVDPDHRPASTRSSEPGALVEVDDDPFLPLPVNEVQLRILHQVDSKAQTLVQGPPGTGKTHTAAALLSHLLAQGKRVLVTAQTDRALKEVRAKLPESIAALAVSVVGSSRSDLADLKVAVERISHTAAEHDPEAARRAIEDHVAAIDELRRHRAALRHRLVEARAAEVAEHDVRGHQGTLAEIARRIEDERPRFAWLTDLVAVGAADEPPVDQDTAITWHRLLLDRALIADEPEARQRLLALAELPEPDAFAALVAAERAATAEADRFADLAGHQAFPAVQALPAATRADLRQRLSGLADEADELARRREDWMGDALTDVRTGRAAIWHSRATQVQRITAEVTPVVDLLGPLTSVTANGEVGALAQLARSLREHLAGGGKLKTNPDGTVKAGAFAPKVVKLAQPLFDGVRVNDTPPTTTDQLDAFLRWVEATRSLDALDRAWPESVRIPAEDTLRERLDWHTTELAQLTRVLDLAVALEREERELEALGLPRPEWHDLNAVRAYARLVDAAHAFDARAAAGTPLAALADAVAEVGRWADAAPCVRGMVDAVRDRDHEHYGTHHRRLTRLVEARALLARRDETTARLHASAPALLAEVECAPDEPEWPGRLAGWTAAWAWAATRAWVADRPRADVNATQDEVTRVDGRVRDRVQRLAAERAWAHAVAPARLSGQAKANLQQYAQLVKRLGKGTGRYAAQQRAEIRAAMDRCRAAVPVWIMPVYRIAEQFAVRPDMFDVVVVDEASQAGVEATFLQYLAPRIVVIGDDRQVSPTAVGTDQQQIRKLADQYLWDDPYKASWQDPKRSLFDEAKMRFEGLLTLTEHRRCVPEIIGFSNRIAYEPDGIRLIPVRQYGADRLEPIKPVFLAEGYERGGDGNKVNPVEVEAIVDQIEKCAADPRYDGLTFGVVSLLGRAQATAIEKRLLARIPPEEWAARDLRCGDSADFQGSERDVVFLSMVKAPDPGKRIGALTADLYVQRYNVAASRAKDQMWVFHSVSLSDLGNPEDMRFQLLDYCYGVAGRAAAGEGATAGPVPEHERVEPFDSLFEQRVHNRLVGHGYAVVPQYPSQGYRIDLVVVGAKARLAIECDGDAWHGPDAYERDLARQRDLERCGWHFFRIPESEFYLDQAEVLDRLWGALHALDIHPSGWVDTRRATSGAVVERTPVAVAPEVAAPDIAVPVEAERDAVTPAVVPPAVAESDTPVPVVVPPVAPVPVPGAAARSGVEVSEPAEYVQFGGAVPAVTGASRADLVAGLESVVAAEGPVLGQRLHTAYVRASGGNRIGKLIATDLNRAIGAAVRAGRLVEDNPLGEAGAKPRTYRLPDQPAFRVRHLGPRSFEEIPPAELAALLDLAASRDPGADLPALYRTALELLGLKRLTDNVKARLNAANSLRA
ncbi:AAA domain-containing protein [Actinokineospora auranticolor]|nr:AAA domain-containing protein [Actinokineospora auranticolor]